MGCDASELAWLRDDGFLKEYDTVFDKSCFKWINVTIKAELTSYGVHDKEERWKVIYYACEVGKFNLIA